MMARMLHSITYSSFMTSELYQSPLLIFTERPLRNSTTTGNSCSPEQWPWWERFRDSRSYNPASKLLQTRELSGRLVNTDCWDTSTEYGSVGLEWHLRIYISSSNKFSGVPMLPVYRPHCKWECVLCSCK